jgi:hypothetical protein
VSCAAALHRDGLDISSGAIDSTVDAVIAANPGQVRETLKQKRSEL